MFKDFNDITFDSVLEKVKDWKGYLNVITSEESFHTIASEAGVGVIESIITDKYPKLDEMCKILNRHTKAIFGPDPSFAAQENSKGSHFAIAIGTGSYKPTLKVTFSVNDAFYTVWTASEEEERHRILALMIYAHLKTINNRVNFLEFVELAPLVMINESFKSLVGPLINESKAIRRWPFLDWCTSHGLRNTRDIWLPKFLPKNYKDGMMLDWLKTLRKFIANWDLLNTYLKDQAMVLESAYSTAKLSRAIENLEKEEGIKSKFDNFEVLEAVLNEPYFFDLPELGSLYSGSSLRNISLGLYYNSPIRGEGSLMYGYHEVFHNFICELDVTQKKKEDLFTDESLLWDLEDCHSFLAYLIQSEEDAKRVFRGRQAYAFNRWSSLGPEG